MVDSDLLYQKEITIFCEESQFIFDKSVRDENKLTQNHKVYSFNKETYKLQRLNDFTPRVGTGHEVYSILGILNGQNNYYLLGVSKATFMGKIINSRIFKIDELVYISSVSNDNNNVIPQEDHKYINMIKDFLQRNTLYFSDTMDLSISLQKTFTNNSNKNSSFIFPYSIPHFCWNYNMTRSLDLKGMENFVAPVINGFFSLRTLSEYPGSFNFIIIARKDSRRSGMRYLVRGSDNNGNVANFVETEEAIVITNYKQQNKLEILSYLQIRGSIPLIWKQSPDIKYTPLIIPRDDFSLNSNVFRKHLNELVTKYGKTILVNLIDKKNNQGEIGEYFQNLAIELRENKIGPNKEFEYTWFDFHQECKNLNYDNLSKLLRTSSVSQALNMFEFFHVVLDSSANFGNLRNDLTNLEGVEVLSLQKGVFRVNCIDCLDRTNVVQTLFARNILHKMLYKLKLSEEPSGETFEKFKEVFEERFKNLWADHGDSISLAYSGTKALKSDFVRKGKKSIKGNIDDGINSCKRYIINNYIDGHNQDCHDFFLVKLNPKKDNMKEHSTKNLKIITPTALVLAFSFYYFSIGLALPSDYEDNLRKKILRSLIFLGIFYLTFRMIFKSVKKLILSSPTLDSS